MSAGSAADIPVAGTVVIVNWDGRCLLDRCLPRLRRSLAETGRSWDVVVVDNGSTDGSVESLRERHADVRLIVNDSNRGFSPAANQGIASARGEMVALLNNDVEVTDRWLAELACALDADRRLASVAALMCYADQPTIVNSAGFDVDLAGRAYDRHDGSPVVDVDTDVHDVFGASAGAALYRTAVLRQLGAFDEGFFAYLEDVDLAWRARRLGYRSAVVPSAVVFHQRSATSDRVHGLKARLSARNHLWMLAKNASLPQLVVAAPILLALSAWTALLAVRHRDASAVRGLVDGVRGLPSYLRRRSPGRSLPLRAFVRPRPFRYHGADRRRRRS